MKEITTFDPRVTGDGLIHTLGINKGEQLVLYNASPYGLRLTFVDGSIARIPPAWAKDFIIKSVPMGDVKWEVFIALSLVTPYSIYLVFGEIYEDGEHIPGINAAMAYPLNQ
jgi:hypothetical protein